MKKLNEKLEKLMELFGIHIHRQDEEDTELNLEDIEKAQMYVTNFLDSSKPGEQMIIKNK